MNLYVCYVTNIVTGNMLKWGKLAYRKLFPVCHNWPIRCKNSRRFQTRLFQLVHLLSCSSSTFFIPSFHLSGRLYAVCRLHKTHIHSLNCKQLFRPRLFHQLNVCICVCGCMCTFSLATPPDKNQAQMTARALPHHLGHNQTSCRVLNCPSLGLNECLWSNLFTLLYYIILYTWIKNVI